MNLTAACVLIAWYSQEKWVCLLTSTWYLLSPSLMSVYLLTCIFCRWFGYNLVAGTQSFPVQPALQQLSHMAGVFSSWSDRVVFVLHVNATLLLQRKTSRREEKTFPGLSTQALPTWQQVPLVTGSWDKVFTRESKGVTVHQIFAGSNCFCLGTTPKPGFASCTFWNNTELEAFNNADFMLHRVFQIGDRQSDGFWHLGEAFA